MSSTPAPTTAQSTQRSQTLGLRTSVRWARAITWTLVIGTAGCLAWLALAKTDQIVVAPGKLEPTGQVREVQLSVGGVVRSVKVREGQAVEAGELLLVLETENNVFQLGTLNQQLQLKQQEMQSKQTQLQSFLSQNDTQLGQLQRSLLLQRELLGRFEQLEGQGASSEVQTLQQRNRVDELEGQIAQVQQERTRRAAELTQQLQELRGQNAELNSRRQEASQLLKYHQLVAPVAGVVFDLQVQGQGVVRAGQPVLKLVPYDELEANVEIPSSEIGFVKLGQSVDLNIDSFPANDFGVLQGTVARVGSDALPPDPIAGKTNYRFPAQISLNSQNLQLADGRTTLPLQVGMSLQAHIKLRKVSYLQLLTTALQSKTDSLRRL